MVTFYLDYACAIQAAIADEWFIVKPQKTALFQKLGTEV